MTNMNFNNIKTFNINNITLRFFNSGIYEKPFFTQIRNIIEPIKKYNKFNLITYNQNLFKIYHGDDFIESSNTEEELNEELDNYFWEKISYWEFYFQPLKYNEEIAHHCDLIPFKYKDQGLLALNGCGMDLSPKLDAYQALTHGTIDPNSRLFSKKSFFEYIAGIDLTKEVIKAISNIKD